MGVEASGSSSATLQQRGWSRVDAYMPAAAAMGLQHLGWSRVGAWVPAAAAVQVYSKAGPGWVHYSLGLRCSAVFFQACLHFSRKPSGSLAVMADLAYQMTKKRSGSTHTMMSHIHIL